MALETSPAAFTLSGTTERARLRAVPLISFTDKLSTRYGSFLDVGFAQELGSFFRRRWIDIKPCAPFKPCRFRQLWHEFDMPVIVVVRRILRRRRVDHQVIRWVVEHLLGATQQFF